MTKVRVRTSCGFVCGAPERILFALFASALIVSCGGGDRDSEPGARQWIALSKDVRTARRMAKVPSDLISFDTTEGTFISVDVSPNGEMLLIDLLGDIYSLPIDGGDAAPLTTGRAWDQAPRFSPDGTYAYFLSDRKGHKNIWRLKFSDRSLQQVTQSDSDILGGPNWSQDGTRLIVGRADSDPDIGNSEIVLHSVDPSDGAMVPLERARGPWIDFDTLLPRRQRIITFSGVQTADDQLYFSELQFGQTHHTVRMFAFNVQAQTRAPMTPRDSSYSEYKPLLSHDGTLLAYFRQYNDRRTEIRILNRTTGQDEKIIELTDADDASYTADDDSRPNYAFTPDDQQLVFSHGGKLHLVSLDDGSSGIIPFRVTVKREAWARAETPLQHIGGTGEATVIRWPSVSRDGQTMVFTAIGYVWIMDLSTGAVRRLTESGDFEYMPAISSDGHSVVYVSFAQSKDDYGPGRLMVAEVDGGMPREVLAGRNATYLLPKWSQDGQKIAVIREVEGASGIQAAFGWTQAAQGMFQEVALAPASSDRASRHIYARFVGFDESDRNLLFSFARSEAESVLGTAAIDGGIQSLLAIGTAEVGGIVPAPDLKHLALTRDDGTIWLVPFGGSAASKEVRTSAPNARRISAGSGYYVDWNGSEQFTFGFGQNVYRHVVNRSGVESLRVKLPFEKPKATQPIAFTGARLIRMLEDDGAEPVTQSGTVVLTGQRIIAVGPTSQVPLPSNAVVIDVTGKTIIPGLLDTHYHRLGGWGFSALALPNGDFNDRSAIMYGITTAWEPGGKVDDGVAATVDLQVSGRIFGPRWSHSAAGSVGRPWEHLTSYSSAVATIARYRELGVVVLKEYNAPTRQQRQWLSAAAREMGLGIVSHIQSFDGMMTRIVDGFTGGDHPYIPVPFYKDVHEMLRQTGYIWTPNIAITSGTVGTSEDRRGYYCHALSRKRTNREIEERSSICDGNQTIPTVPYDIHRVGRVAKQAALAARDGLYTGVSAHGMPGSNLHQEIWYLWKGGMPIEDVLRAATMGNAAKLGLQEQIGSLEAGKIADILVLDENPMDNIFNTLSLKYTVQGGVVYDSETGQPLDLTSIRKSNTAVGH